MAEGGKFRVRVNGTEVGGRPVVYHPGDLVSIEDDSDRRWSLAFLRAKGAAKNPAWSVGDMDEDLDGEDDSLL